MGKKPGQPSALRVLIADDHAIVRHGLREILSEGRISAIVAEAKDGYEAIKLGLAEKWDVILLDITMPGPHGLEVLRRLMQERPRPCVLMLSMHADPFYVKRALGAGAAGYLTKESAPDELITAIQSVLAGQVYLGQALHPLA